jgi:imidazolonepropionase-like amidohydrolase
MLTAALLTVALSLAAPPAAPRAVIVDDVTVIATDDGTVLPHRTVLIRDGRIAKIVEHGSKLRVRGAEIVPGNGRWLVPGFVDTHVHITTEGAIRASKDAAIAGLDLGDDRAYERHVMLTFLRAGVTGVANLGGGVRGDESLLRLRDDIAAGRIAGPRLFVGKRINGPRAAVGKIPPDPAPVSTPDAPTTAADGIAAVRAAKAKGYDFIKPYQFLNRETYRAVVDEARTLGLRTTGHLPELGCGTCADRAFAFEHPLDNIAHAEELARYGRETNLAPADATALADLVAQRGIAVTPTLATLKTIVRMYVERAVPPVPAPWLDLVDPVTRRDWSPPANRYLSEAFRAQEGADMFSAGYDFARVLTRELWKRGVRLTVGTDAALPGLPFGVSVQQEMIELREIGLTPVEVLRAASINANALFAPREGGGAVREGQRADLVLLDADPLADIHNVAKIAGVFAHGRWLSIGEIDAQLAALAPRMTAIARQLDAPREER